LPWPSGIGVARPPGTLRGSNGGCAEQGGVVGFSPWGGENGLTRRHSKAAAELRWPKRVLTSPTVAGGDGGGEAGSKRGGRRLLPLYSNGRICGKNMGTLFSFFIHNGGILP
jgi:hypothetical protein